MSMSNMQPVELESTVTAGAALELASDIVAAYVSKNPVQLDQLPVLLKDVHETLISLSAHSMREPTELKPAIPIKKSVTDLLSAWKTGRSLNHLSVTYAPNMT